MKIGDLDTRIELWTHTIAQDSFGQPIETRSKHGKAWAKRFDRNAGEVVIGDRVVSVVKTEFTIRYKGDLDETWEIKHDGKYFRIDGILVLGRNRFMKLMCSRRDD